MDPEDPAASSTLDSETISGVFFLVPREAHYWSTRGCSTIEVNGKAPQGKQTGESIINLVSQRN